MKKYIYPKKETWSYLCQRPYIDNNKVSDVVEKIFNSVKQNGDSTLLNLAKTLDGANIENLKISNFEITNARDLVSDKLKRAIKIAKSNIKKYHSSQLIKEPKVETSVGITCWRKNVAIEKVGLYIPGGTAPLFSTILMLGIPATLAGCDKIILCTPPQSDGTIHPAILYTADVLGINEIYKVGGAQAIAAMSHGTETIPKVDKIFGPGNQYVTEAKSKAQSLGVAIDMPAGPSELLVIADGTSIPSYIAADLLSQAEHGADSQVTIVSHNEFIIDQVLNEIKKQIQLLPRKNETQQSIANSRAILFKNERECLEYSNAYAPEHLIIASANADDLINKVVNAGSVFLGNYSCESAGDYASGTNHTLPTNGYAKAYSGVSVDSFVKKITFQKISKEGLENIGPTIETMAAAEGLQAHRMAVSLRLKSLRNE